MFSPTQQLPVRDAQRLFAGQSQRGRINSRRLTSASATTQQHLHDPSGNCRFTQTPLTLLLPPRHDARDVPPTLVIGRGPAPCAMQPAPLGLDRSGLQRHLCGVAAGAARRTLAGEQITPGSATPLPRRRRKRNESGSCLSSPRICMSLGVAEERCLHVNMFAAFASTSTASQ